MEAEGFDDFRIIRRATEEDVSVPRQQMGGWGHGDDFMEADFGWIFVGFSWDFHGIFMVDDGKSWVMIGKQTLRMMFHSSWSLMTMID